MKISNFNYWSKEKAKEYGNVHRRDHATIDTCSFFFNKKKDVEITNVNTRWVFNHSGKFVSIDKIVDLVRAADIADKIGRRSL